MFSHRLYSSMVCVDRLWEDLDLGDVFLPRAGDAPDDLRLAAFDIAWDTHRNASIVVMPSIM